MDFQQALKSSDLGTALLAAGRAAFTQEAADLAIAVAKLEPISPSVIAFTHCCEHSFEIKPSLPNVNGKPECVWNWDVGPFQLNLQWTMRAAFQSEIKSTGLKFAEVFGVAFYAESSSPSGRGIKGEGVSAAVSPHPSPLPAGEGDTAPPLTPCAFSGISIANGRMAARVLLSRGSDDKTKAVKFTGPEHQERRALLYDALMPSFVKFFELYSPG